MEKKFSYSHLISTLVLFALVSGFFALRTHQIRPQQTTSIACQVDIAGARCHGSAYR